MSKIDVGKGHNLIAYCSLSVIYDLGNAGKHPVCGRAKLGESDRVDLEGVARSLSRRKVFDGNHLLKPQFSNQLYGSHHAYAVRLPKYEQVPVLGHYRIRIARDSGCHEHVIVNVAAHF